MLTKRNFDGSVVTYAYDPVTGRLDTVTYPDGSTEDYLYNEDSGSIKTVTETDADDNQRLTSFGYHPLFGSPNYIAKPEGTLKYDYYSNGLLSKVASGDREVEYQYYYDTLGRLKDAETPTGNAHYTYNEDGSRKSLTYPNQMKVNYTYNNMGQLKGMETRKSDNTLLATFDYELSSTGLRTGVSEVISEGVNEVTAELSYTYDKLGRLTDAIRDIAGGTTSTTYEYDIVGNRLAKWINDTSTAYIYNAIDQVTEEIKNGATTTYTYDANGNLTTKTTPTKTTNYIFNSRNRLIKNYDGAIDPANLQSEYKYDYAGNRFERRDYANGQLGNISGFLIDNHNLTGYSQTFYEFDGKTGDITKRYEYGDDLTTQINTITTGGGSGSGSGIQTSQAFCFLYDGLGSTRALIDFKEDLKDNFSLNYTPFGEALDFNPTEVSTSYLFTGESYDNNLEMYHLRARYYDPSIGRFISFDPAEDMNNKLHKYNYCADDPINNLDPSGQLFEVTILSIILFTIVKNLEFPLTPLLWGVDKPFGLENEGDFPPDKFEYLIQFISDHDELQIYEKNISKLQEKKRKNEIKIGDFPKGFFNKEGHAFRGTIYFQRDSVDSWNVDVLSSSDSRLWHSQFANFLLLVAVAIHESEHEVRIGWEIGYSHLAVYDHALNFLKSIEPEIEAMCVDRDPNAFTFIKIQAIDAYEGVRNKFENSLHGPDMPPEYGP